MTLPLSLILLRDKNTYALTLEGYFSRIQLPWQLPYQIEHPVVGWWKSEECPMIVVITASEEV